MKLRIASRDVTSIRSQRDGLSLRADDGGARTLHGHFSVFNTWYLISSFWEGEFMERVAPGAFEKTIRDDRSSMKVLFNHGHDPSIGSKVLGPIDTLREDSKGAYYEVPLLRTSYNDDLIPGLEARQYGASFRFRVEREEIEESPEPSDHNPRGLQERTIVQARVFEFGPVTFPANPDADAGVRSRVWSPSARRRVLLSL